MARAVSLAKNAVRRLESVATVCYHASVARRDTLAVYGNVVMVRGHCRSCKTTAIVLDGVLQCCDSKYSSLPEAYERMSEPLNARKLAPKADRERKLREQEGRCHYCQRLLDSHVFRKGRLLRLRLHWDHQVPFSYAQNNHESNFVASCHICNGIKSDLLFQTDEQARSHIAEAWQRKGYSDMPEV